MKKVTNYQEAMEACLELWKGLSTSEHQNKRVMLKSLGYENMAYSCPFCSLYHQIDVCYDCPIVIYSGYNCEEKPCPYWYWIFECSSNETAKAFYEFLLEVKEALTEDGSALKE
jgi:hypothetical protein